ncbi:MAG: radical SAM protein, partial [Candidatus Woesearchaeota archaeon]|nr:radical SAM protein [Candidatus Woesearchaeota archaeon]
MAVGFSGSNGGINVKSSTLHRQDFIRGPLEISYFVNNVCNLSCRHCYVGYEEPKNALSVEEWQNIFNQALELGALTFGNVGKEPLLAWNKSVQLLNFLKQKKQENPRIRYGLVTNATSFDDERIKQLIEADPTYLDISIDGTREIHDSVRGFGNYDKSLSAIEKILCQGSSFSDRLFISFTLMGANNDVSLIKKMIGELQERGVKRFMVSPYVVSINQNGRDIGITKEQVADTYERLKTEANAWLGSQDQLLLKVDYDTQKPLMDLLVERGIIELGKLMIDDYATIFTRFGNIYINYIPVPRTLIRDVRISHDG